jgi:hypothetical protein
MKNCQLNYCEKSYEYVVLVALLNIKSVFARAVI